MKAPMYNVNTKRTRFKIKWKLQPVLMATGSGGKNKAKIMRMREERTIGCGVWFFLCVTAKVAILFRFGPYEKELPFRRSNTIFDHKWYALINSSLR